MRDQYDSAARSGGLSTSPPTDTDNASSTPRSSGSVSGDPAGIASVRGELRVKVIEPRAVKTPTTVIEACTDFDLGLGLGLNSLGIFAEHMVSDCYRRLDFDEPRK